MDTSEGSGDDGNATKVTGLQSGMLTRRSLSVVPVTNDNPADTLCLVVTSNSRDSIPLAVGQVVHLVGLSVGSVDGANQHVVGDVVQVTTVLQPGAGHGDVVSGRLTLGLDQDGQVGSVLAIPSVEGRQELQTVRGRSNLDVHGGAVLGRCLVRVHARVVATGRETVTGRRLELELLAILVLERVGQRVEVQRAGDGHGDDEIGRGNEGVSSGVTVVSASEVTVVGRDDGVGLALLDVLAVPLTNARTAGVGKNNTAVLLKSLQLTITGNGGANLLGTGSNSEDRLGLETVVQSVTGDGGATGHVLVRRVGARANETDLQVLGPVVVLDGLGELRDGSSQIGGEGTVDVRLEFGQVDLDQLVVLGALVLTQLLGVDPGEITNVLALGGGEVVVHAVVEGEDGGRGTDFSTHVAVWLLEHQRCASREGEDLPDCTHTSCAECVHTLSEIPVAQLVHGILH